MTPENRPIEITEDDMGEGFFNPIEEEAYRQYKREYCEKELMRAQMKLQEHKVKQLLKYSRR